VLSGEITARVEPPSEVDTPMLAGKGLVLSGVGNPRAVGNVVELPVQLLHEATNEQLELTLSIRIG